MLVLYRERHLVDYGYEKSFACDYCQLSVCPEDRTVKYPDFLSSKPLEDRNKQAIYIFVPVEK